MSAEMTTIQVDRDTAEIEALSKIPGSMTPDFVAERDER